MNDDSEIERLASALWPVIQEMVQVSMQQAVDSVLTQRAMPGTVTDVDGSWVYVAVSQPSGDSGSPTPGQIQCIRMAGVQNGSRVRVHFFPDAAAEAHLVQT